MTHPSVHSRIDPDRAAIIVAETAETMSYGELDVYTLRAAHALRRAGLRRGDAVALLLGNGIDYLALCWAAQRSGLYYVMLPLRSTVEEASLMLRDCGAKALITSDDAPAMQPLLSGIAELAPSITHCFVIGASRANGLDWYAAMAQEWAEPLTDASSGGTIIYSSGTTGRPKALKWPLSDLPPETSEMFGTMLSDMFDLDGSAIYLSPAPLYHMAPLAYCMAIHQLGGTTVIMKHFEAEEVLAHIERYRVTAAQFVPTMFVRMLKLPGSARSRYDLSSLRVVLHSAAPCAPMIKKAMIDWLGPIIFETYGGSEGNGMTLITSEQWLRKPGSVGRAIWGEIHIVGEDGRELDPGAIGDVFFSGADSFEYFNDDARTTASRHPTYSDWSTIGDVGYIDSDGYLFLTDRRAFMIISGGVNIYPQEIEDLLIGHPNVTDVAVFGVPDADLGEAVKAVVEPLDWNNATAALTDELMALCREHLSPIKRPRSIDFDQKLPRTDTGKLMKLLLRDRYWQGHDKRVH